MSTRATADGSHVLDRFFHPAILSRELRERPALVTVAGTPVALFRDPDGAVGALADRCPHRGAKLSAGSVSPDGGVVCPYHGWRFGRDGAASCPAQPELSLNPARAYRVVEHDGVVWLASDALSAPTPQPLASEGMKFFGVDRARFDAPLHSVVDNLAECEHMAYLHVVHGWDEQSLGAIDYSWSEDEDAVHASYRGRPRQPIRLVRRLLDDLRFEISYALRFDPVCFTFRFRAWSHATGIDYPVRAKGVMYCVPETDQTTMTFAFHWLRVDAPMSLALTPVVGALYRAVSKVEVWLDRRFMPRMYHGSDDLDLAGVHFVSRFDRPLPRIRKRLRRAYWARPVRLPAAPDVAAS